MPKTIAIDDDLLRQAVRDSTSFAMVARRVATNPNGLYRRIRKRISDLELDTSHFTSVPRRGPTWTNEQLRIAVAQSRSIAQTIRALGLVAAGGNYDQVQRRIKELSCPNCHSLQPTHRGLNQKRRKTS